MNAFDRDYAHRFADDYDVLRKYSTDGKGDRTINWPLIWGWSTAAVVCTVFWVWVGRAAYAYWSATR